MSSISFERRNTILSKMRSSAVVRRMALRSSCTETARRSISFCRANRHEQLRTHPLPEYFHDLAAVDLLPQDLHADDSFRAVLMNQKATVIQPISEPLKLQRRDCNQTIGVLGGPHDSPGVVCQRAAKRVRGMQI